MLDELRVIGKSRAGVAGEFPSVRISFDVHAIDPHLRASQWLRDDFDTWAFDVAVDELASAPFALCIADDVDHDAFAVEVLNRCQRWIARRNEFSAGETFDRVLERHREMHDLAKPLVRADYNHARDVWQWTLRLEPRASLAVQIAALFHDIERLASEADKRVEHLAPDYQAFKDAHASAGAEMTRRILRDVPRGIVDRVAQLVGIHERRSDDAEVALLNDTDALSFFSLNSNGYADYFGPEQTRKKVEYTWNRMSDRARTRLHGIRIRSDVRRFLP